MTGYIAGFTFYTLAIIGIIFLAFIVAKKSMMVNVNSNRKDQFLSIETSLNIAPRKTLHIIKAGDEKFLISADPERTTFLTKLACENISNSENNLKIKNDVPEKVKLETISSSGKGIMKCILNKLNKI